MTAPERPPPEALSLAELCVLLAGFALAVVTTAATATGLAEAHALRTIGAVSLAFLLAGGALALRRPVRLEVAPRDLLFALLLGGLAAALFLPGCAAG